MKLLPVLLLVIAAAAIRVTAAEIQPEMKTELDPMVVNGGPPLLKITEHPVIQPRYGAAVVAEGNYLYIVGGGNEEGTRLDSVERVDLRTGHSEPWARLQVPRRFHRAVVFNGKIYVLGGTTGLANGRDKLAEELVEYLEEFPPLEKERPPNLLAPPENLRLPPTVTQRRTERAIAAASSTGGFQFRYLGSMEEIDLATGRVTLGPPMPVPKALFGCVVVDGKILVIGGQKRRHNTLVCTNTTEVFDPATDRWSAGVNLPAPRRGAACIVDGFIVFAGGYGKLGAGRVVEVFNPREGTWRRFPDLSEAVNPYSTVSTGNYLFFFGDQGRLSSQLAYDLRAKQLVPYPLRLPDSYLAAAVAYHDRIYVVGGATPMFRDITGTVQVFVPAPEPDLGKTPTTEHPTSTHASSR